MELICARLIRSLRSITNCCLTSTIVWLVSAVWLTASGLFDRLSAAHIAVAVDCRSSYCWIIAGPTIDADTLGTLSIQFNQHTQMIINTLTTCEPLLFTILWFALDQRPFVWPFSLLLSTPSHPPSLYAAMCVRSFVVKIFGFCVFCLEPTPPQLWYHNIYRINFLSHICFSLFCRLGLSVRARSSIFIDSCCFFVLFRFLNCRPIHTCRCSCEWNWRETCLYICESHWRRLKIAIY